MTETEVNDRLRSSLGIWYATSYLAGIGLQQIDSRMGAIAKEALQWQQDSFLADVVVYFRSEGEERVQQFCVVSKDRMLCGPETTKSRFDDFLKKLVVYVDEFGSSVRTEAHLRPGPVGGQNASPVKRPAGFYECFRSLKLPQQSSRTGNASAYADAVRACFAEAFPPGSDGYHVLHLAAGSNTGHDDWTKSMSAVAHLYVVFQGKQGNYRQFASAMREVLSRLAISFSLGEMEKVLQERSTIADREKKTHVRLVDKILDLDKSIRMVEDAARGVRAMMTKDPWMMVELWTRVLDRLFDTQKNEVPICGSTIQSKHSKWDQEYFAAALLALVNAQDLDIISRLSFEQKWGFYREYIYKQQSEINPIWRCLHRMGMLDRQWTTEERSIIEDAWKTALTDKRRMFEKKNQATLLMLQFSIGAKPAEGSNFEGSPFELEDFAEVRVIAYGLHNLFESLLRKKGLLDSNRPDFRYETHFLLNQNTLQIGFTESYLGSPLIAQEGFGKVAQTVKMLTNDGTRFPESSRHDTSLAVLQSLGVDRESWTDEAPRVKTRESDSAAVWLEASDGRESASISFRDGGLWASYALKESN